MIYLPELNITGVITIIRHQEHRRIRRSRKIFVNSGNEEIISQSTRYFALVTSEPVNGRGKLGEKRKKKKWIYARKSRGEIGTRRREE